MAGKTDFHTQEILNRCFVPASNALATTISSQSGTGGKADFSVQEIWNRIFSATSNCLKLM